MDKLAQRAGVATLVLIASAGTALAFTLLRMASSLDGASAAGGPAPPVVAAIHLPSAIITTFEGETPLVAPAVVVPPRKPAKASAVLVNRPKTTLAPMRVAAAAPPPSARADERDDPELDRLDVGLGMKTRARGLDDRGSKAFAIRQMAGMEQVRRPRQGGERLTFETDLGRPDR